MLYVFELIHLGSACCAVYFSAETLMERPDAAAWISVQTRGELVGKKVIQSPATKPVWLDK